MSDKTTDPVALDDDLGIALLCAWNNVPGDNEAMRRYWDEHMRGDNPSKTAWVRVASTARAFLGSNLLASEAAREDAGELETRLWAVIDHRGLENCPSDIVGAVAYLKKRAKQAEAAEKRCAAMREALDGLVADTIRAAAPDFGKAPASSVVALRRRQTPVARKRRGAS